MKFNGKEKKMNPMTGKQRFSMMMMCFIGLALLILPVRMIATGDYRLWAVELALLCAFAVMLRIYALEWRKLRDEDERRKRK